MNKNLSIFLALIISAAFITACGGGKPYGDVVESSDDFTANYQSFESEMNEASNAKEAAAALNNFAKGMEMLIPEMKALNEKYPELEESKEELPENVQAAITRMETAMASMPNVMMKTMQYMQHPEFQKAQQNLMAVFEKLEDME